jgi:predicted alpha/beta superfamily hydrolase
VPIVVSIGNGAQLRLEEMTAWADQGVGGRAQDFVGWIADVLVPRIVRDFGVQPGPVGAAMCGSSMGGLASLYAHHLRPDVFGGAVCMSSSLFWAGRRIFDFVAHGPVPPLSRIYLDCGAREAGGRMVGWTREMGELLASRGYGPDRLMVRIDPRGAHNERAWRRRLPRALRFLYRR